MYGCMTTESVSVEGDLGVLFMHNEGYSTMCGHGIIALVTVDDLQQVQVFRLVRHCIMPEVK